MEILLLVYIYVSKFSRKTWFDVYILLSRIGNVFPSNCVNDIKDDFAKKIPIFVDVNRYFFFIIKDYLQYTYAIYLS